MTAIDIVKSVCAYRHVSVTKLAERLKLSRGGIYYRLNQNKDMMVDSFVETLEQMGYSVIAMPTNTLDKLYKNEYLLTSSKRKKKEGTKDDGGRSDSGEDT